MMTRRRFMETVAAAGVAAGSIGLFKPSRTTATPHAVKDDISLAQWALVEEIQAGKWKTLDFAKVARQDFGISGIEYVNTLFENPTAGYLAQLKQNVADQGVTSVLIMVDDEGETCTPDKAERKQTVINHQKWIDIAHYLGCHAIRTNCRGKQGDDPQEALKWSADTYQQMLEYAIPANISILIENHGGFSNDADWMAALFKLVNSLYFGSYPDWRSPSKEFDNYAYIQKMLPWAGGLSYRNQPDEETTKKLIELCYNSGYRGWYGIESSGRDAIRQGKELLTKHLLSKYK